MKPGSPGYIPSIFPVGKVTPVQTTPRTTKNSSQSVLSDTETPIITERKRQPRRIFRPVWLTTDHDYVATRVDPDPPTEVEMLHHRIEELQKEKAAMAEKILNIDIIKRSDEACLFYTNFPNYLVFKALCDYLESRSAGRLRYWRGSETSKFQHFGNSMNKKPGPQRKLTFEEEFFLTVVRLKLGGTAADLAKRVGCDASYVSRVFTTWVTFLAEELRQLFEMKEDTDSVAQCFKDFPNLTIILDCTEQQIERSSDLQARKETYSNYKSRDTLKWLVGLSRNLTVNYVSPAYGGRASDKHITLDSGLLDLLSEGSSAMADRGFPVGEELKAQGVELILPDFKGRDRSQMTRDECNQSEFVAQVRIHVERIIQRIRTYHIFDSTAKLSMKDIYESIFMSCAYLTNFQLPIIREEKQPAKDFYMHEQWTDSEWHLLWYSS